VTLKGHAATVNLCKSDIRQKQQLPVVDIKCFSVNMGLIDNRATAFIHKYTA